MSVLIPNDEHPPVGGEAPPVTANICRRLSKAGHTTTVVTMALGTLPVQVP